MIRYDFSDAMEFKYIGSSREGYSPTNIDFDNTALDIFDVPAEYKDENSTHELQINYVGDSVNIVSGLYLYDGESCGNFDAILGFLGRAAFGTPGLTREVTGCNNSESWAIYSQATFQITDGLSMTVGGRYTDEDKTAIVNNGLIFDNAYPRSNWIPGYTRPDGQLVPTVLGSDSDDDGILDAPKTENWTRFTPRLGIEYQAADNMMLFASFSQGFKSGTFNPRATTNEGGVNPEIVDSYEVGLKADWNDNFRTNVTLFSLDHKDRQYVGIGEGSSATDLLQVLRNVAATSAKGLEAEVTYVASDYLTFNLAYGYIDEKIEKNNSVPPLIGLANTPSQTVNLSANYVIESDVGDFTMNAGYYHRGDYLLFETSTLLKQEAYGLFNVSINWQSVEGDWYASLHGKNLTDEEYLVGGYDFVGVADDGSLLPGLGGDLTLIGYYGDPRTIHLTIGYRF
jgi:iron complex outermembrane receptor protein